MNYDWCRQLIYIYIYRTCKIRNFLNCNEATFSWRSARIQDVINLINSALWVIQAIACRVSSLVKRVLFLSSPFFFFLFFFLSTPRVAYVSHVHSELFRNGMCRSCSVDYLHSCNTTQWYRLVDLLLSLILKRRLLNRALFFWNIFKRVQDCLQNIYINLCSYLGIERVEKVRLELRK